jgi:DNA polymerase IV (DinB-like DNA polymerase)
VTPPFDVSTRARSLPGPVADPELVERVALDLFDEFAGEPVRKLGVRLSKLSVTDERQPTLDAWDGETDEQARDDGTTADRQRSLGEFGE